MTSYDPHKLCLLQDSWMMAFHLLGDAMIALAYFAIPTALWYCARKKRNMPLRGIVIWFGIFIIGCGLTHVGNVLELFVPWYALTGVVKFGTAAVSWITMAKLLPLLPQVLALPSTTELEELRLRIREPIPEMNEAMLEDMEALVSNMARITRMLCGKADVPR